MIEVILYPTNQVHSMFAKLRLTWGMCPRCASDPHHTDNCAVCLLWKPNPNSQPVVYKRITDGQINTDTQKSWWKLWMLGVTFSKMSRKAASIYERQHGVPPKCL